VDIAFPFRVDATGRTATALTYADHIRDLIEQLLFTSPGERVNRPAFGAGLLPLVFMPNGVGLAGATQAAVQGALAFHLGDRITVEEVTALSDDSTLTISVAYTIIQTGQALQETFVRAAG
jgi:phage baseplate assembly protein W